MEASGESSISFKQPFNPQSLDGFEFVPPPSAPVFRPTQEEFRKGPLEYIRQIRAEAEPYGICKIIPPADFQPEFEVDTNKFSFKPRVQRINELEALTRSKLYFLEKLIKFWNLQGIFIRIPVVEKTHLDLHLLHKTVAEEGGFEICVQNKKWLKVASKLFPHSISKATVSKQLRMHYEKLLYPYDIFLIGASGESNVGCSKNNIHATKSAHNHANNIAINVKEEQKSSDCSFADENHKKQCNNESLSSDICANNTSLPEVDRTPKATHRMSRRSTSQRNTCTTTTSGLSTSSFTRLLRKNQALSESSSCPTSPLGTSNINSSGTSTSSCPSPVSPGISFGKQTPVCHLCSQSDRSRRILQCSRCDKNVHMNCLFPSLSMVPKASWHCADCIEKMLPQMPQPYTNEFGFVESRRKYSLAEFGLLANEFKNNYFGQFQSVGIALSTVEKEFWRLVALIEDSVTVEYGADIHTNQVGSGFATRKLDNNDNNNDNNNNDHHRSHHLNRIDNQSLYVDHPWNLNRLPLLDGSLFRYVNSNINGMIVPWIYVGMCFSTFCWHNEDHWTYSINYLHFGDAKTWYGIPGDAAPKFERAMETIAPELFASQPDLLHQLVTICNPSLLQSYDVPIYRIDQLPGEFVVTFPRSYHAGFNQGFNLAEAVNFAPIDWLALGRRSVREYARLRRYPVFSHEELLFRMAEDESLPAHHVQELFLELLHVIRTERDQRLALLDLGVHKSQHISFDLLPDEQRQCKHCRYTCYLSALVCDCQNVTDASVSQVCLEHVQYLCSTCTPENWTMRHTYKLDQLFLILKKLQVRVAEYETWACDVASCLQLSLSELEESFRNVPELEDMENVDTNERMYQKLMHNKVLSSKVLYNRLRNLENNFEQSDDKKADVNTLNALIMTGKQLHVAFTDRFWIPLVKAYTSTAMYQEQLKHLIKLINDRSIDSNDRWHLERVHDLLQMALISKLDTNQYTLEQTFSDVNELNHRLKELTKNNSSTQATDLDCVKHLIKRLHFINIEPNLREIIDQKPQLSHLLI